MNAAASMIQVCTEIGTKHNSRHGLTLFYIALVLIVLCTSSVATYKNTRSINRCLSMRGGLVPQADSIGGQYIELLEDIDYGVTDSTRQAGSLKGLVKPGRLASLPEKDPFLRWLYEQLEKGPALSDRLTPTSSNRLKPFYAADFGSKADLLPGENPIIYIVTNRLQADTNTGLLARAPKAIEIEKRVIWQPWLKTRCDFAVRYIVPDRVNILKIMQMRGKFSSELQVEKNEKGKITEAHAAMKFKPSVWERFQSGMRDKEVVIRTKLSVKALFD